MTKQDRSRVHLNRSMIHLSSALMLLGLSVSGFGAEVGTRQQTICPLGLTTNTPEIVPSNVAQYVSSGFGQWTWGAGTNVGRQVLTPAESTTATHAARLLTFFSISDIHITDKESPAEVPYLGWQAGFHDDGMGNLNHASYSPVILDTTHHLDAAVRTINALHRLTPFDLGLVLGDNCNAAQYNELRWFIDVMDGQWIVPSSGDHAGATNVDYQIPYQAAGLNPAIPWYEAIGNHDQMWMGIGYPSEKVRLASISSNILEISTNSPLRDGAEGSGLYVGTVDGSTPFGTVVKWGETNLYDTPPTVAADTNRHTLTTDLTWPRSYVVEFTNSTSLPAGHGFDLARTGSLAACYSFLPLTNVPLKVIVLDDTCKLDIPSNTAAFYGDGWVDAVRYSWLTNELQLGQAQDQLMIIACHIPINPQTSFTHTNVQPMFYVSTNPPPYPGATVDPTNYPGCKTEDELIATFHTYPNLLMVIAGHRHVNVVTPFPSPDPDHPESGFWEVETPSLRDYPRQFRTYEIIRNADNTLSIWTTDVDPVVVPGSPADKSLGYAIGAYRIFGDGALEDTSSQTYNAELIKTLTPHMQALIANVGMPLGHRIAIDPADGSGASIQFLGELQTSNSLLAPTWTAVTNTSPYSESTTNTLGMYRAVE